MRQSSLLLEVRMDILPDECLIEIVSHLDTEDWIALTHVNQRFRRIVLDHIYPTKEVRLSKYFERYPPNKCLEVYEVIRRRARRLTVLGPGSVETASHLKFPHLKQLKVLHSSLDDVKWIPATLETLHLEDYVPKQQFNLLLHRLGPTIQDLRVPSRLILNPLPQMQSLRKLKAVLSPSSLGTILRGNPNLRYLDVCFYSKSGEIMDTLLEDFKRAPHLITLKMDFREWTGRITAHLVFSADHLVLPNLKELTIQHNRHDNRQNNWIRHFLQNICNTNLRQLSLDLPFSEKLRFTGLETLRIRVDQDVKGTVYKRPWWN